jgi:RimJ/RimL family protein N-acetyltransferase
MIAQKNSRLVLKTTSLSNENWTRLWAGLNDFDSIKYAPIEKDFLQFKTVKQLKEFSLNFLAESKKNAYYFIYELGLVQNFVGYIVVVDGKNFGMFLLKEYWGGGYGYEALNLFLDYFFNKMNKRKIHLVVYEKNYAAIAIYQKLGFIKTGKSLTVELVSKKPKSVKRGYDIEMSLNKKRYNEIKVENSNWPMKP